MSLTCERGAAARLLPNRVASRAMLLLAGALLVAGCGGQPQASPSAVSSGAAPAGTTPASAGAQPGAASAGAATKPSASGLKTVRFGDVSKTSNSWPEFIADAKGFFAREGIQLEVTYINSAPNVVKAATAGSIDVGSTGYDQAIQGIEGGATVSIIGTPMLRYAYSMMSDPKVKTAADMVGKRATMSSAKTGNDLVFRRWLRTNNISPDKVEYIYIGSTPDRYAALKSGQVQTAALSQPFDFRAADEGYYQLVDFGKFLGDNYAFLADIAPKQWIRDNPDTVRGFLKAYSDGIDYFYDPKNKDEVIAILDKAVGQDHAIDIKTYEYYQDLKPFTRKLAAPDSAVQGTLDSIVDGGQMTTPTPPVSKFLDRTYLPQ